LQLDRSHLRDSVLDGCSVHCLLLRFRPNSAELLVVDQLGHGGMRAADRAIGVLAELKLAEAHAERVNQQQPPDKRLALAKDELDGLGGLNEAQQSGQDSEDSALGAGRN